MPKKKAKEKGEYMAKKGSSIAAIFKSDFEFDTGGKRVNVEKIAKGLAKQMGRQYVCHRAKKLKTKVNGTLVTTRKGTRLTQKQKIAACRML